MANRKNPLLLRVSAVCLAALLAACSSAVLPTPDKLPALPQAFRGGTHEPAVAALSREDAWWQLFGDPVLDDLVARAARDSSSIQAAAAQLQRARALARAADSNRLSQATLQLGATRQAGTLVNAAGDDGTLFSGVVQFRWELDVLGRLQLARQAATLDVAAREGLLRESQLLVQSELVRDYLALRATDAQLALARQLAASHRASVALAERRLANGQISAAGVDQARSESSALDLDLAAATRRRETLEHAIAVLVGAPAPTFRIEGGSLPPDLPKVPSGVPGSVLARRPDVAAALDALLAARARVGVAQTSGGPDANLSASTGLASSGLAQLVRMSARTWGLGALMGLPLWDGGRQEAGVQVADADFSAAQAHYRTRFLGALQDVEDQLSALQALDQQATVTARGTDAAAQALERMRARVAHGLASDQELLVATRSALQAQRQQLEVRSEQFQSTVALVRALGGGWE